MLMFFVQPAGCSAAEQGSSDHPWCGLWRVNVQQIAVTLQKERKGDNSHKLLQCPIVPVYTTHALRNLSLCSVQCIAEVLQKHVELALAYDL